MRGAGVFVYDCSPVISNNTIANNVCTSGSSVGGGIYSNSGGSYSGVNNIVYFNQAAYLPQCAGNVSFNYSCCPVSLSGTGNITADPLFVDPEEKDYHLQSGSLCIDSGDPNSPLDPDSTRADMGALYYDQSGASPDIVIELVYVSGSPVPPGGGNLYYDVYLENAGSDPLDFDAWIDIEYEGGPLTTVIMRSLTNFQPGWTINRPNVFFPVPGGYAAGNYLFMGRVGSHPVPVWNESGFPFTKSGVSDGADFTPWPIAGAPDPFDEMDNVSVVTVSDIELLDVHPNPFNPTTTIGFQLPVASFVKLAVYDISGRLVGARYAVPLLDTWCNAGHHEITFDASHLPSGVYFARLTAGDFQQTQKLLLLK